MKQGNDPLMKWSTGAVVCPFDEVIVKGRDTFSCSQSLTPSSDAPDTNRSAAAPYHNNTYIR